MKKLKQRKGLVALATLAAALLYLGGHSVYEGVIHVGNGFWTYGGDEPGTDSHVSTPEHSEVISQSQYRRECYRMAFTFFLFGGGILFEAIRRWRERDELEKSWKRMISNADNIQNIHKNPELYRDDFKQWIKENRPDLAFWELPPNSSN